ncbi:hypothetical protein LB505_012228 [Fusarium chuoi]|nr:hypothetical protein LB505_012228 [Fusarium chuoi]
MRAALVEDGNLNCLGLISEKKESRNKNLASWVPDFELHSEPFRDYITSLSKVLNKWSIYKAFTSPVGSPPCIKTDEDDSYGLLENSSGGLGPRPPSLNERRPAQKTGREWSTGSVATRNPRGDGSLAKHMGVMPSTYIPPTSID